MRRSRLVPEQFVERFAQRAADGQAEANGRVVEMCIRDRSSTRRLSVGFPGGDGHGNEKSIQQLPARGHGGG